MDLGLKGKSVVVTGGSKGIGFATARAFLGEGAKVIISARDEKEIADAVNELSVYGEIKGVIADATDENSAYELARTAYDTYGSLDCWINNVGASFPKEGSEYDKIQINRIVDVCFSSVVFGTQAAFRYMKDSGGSIVNLSSLAARCGTAGASTLYGPLKAAVLRLAASFAGEYAAYGIRVNAVMPGFTLTPAIASNVDELYLERNALDTLLRRTATPDEIAAPIVFLCGNKASYITGSYIDVSGGRGAVLNPEFSYEKKKEI